MWSITPRTFLGDLQVTLTQHDDNRSLFDAGQFRFAEVQFPTADYRIGSPKLNRTQHRGQTRPKNISHSGYPRKFFSRQSEEPDSYQYLSWRTIL